MRDYHTAFAVGLGVLTAATGALLAGLIGAVIGTVLSLGAWALEDYERRTSTHDVVRDAPRAPAAVSPLAYRQNAKGQWVHASGRRRGRFASRAEVAAARELMRRELRQQYAARQ